MDCKIFIFLTPLIILQGYTYANSCLERIGKTDKCTCKPVNVESEFFKVTCEKDIREIREVDLNRISLQLAHL